MALSWSTVWEGGLNFGTWQCRNVAMATSAFGKAHLKGRGGGIKALHLFEAQKTTAFARGHPSDASMVEWDQLGNYVYLAGWEGKRRM